MAVKKYQVKESLLQKTLKECNTYMTNINNLIGKYDDGSRGEKTLIGCVEKMNEECWSDGRAATLWYQSNQNNLNKISQQMKAIDEDFKTLDLMGNIN